MKKKALPSSQKLNTLYDVVMPPKKLRRLPHLFASVLELPFHSNADTVIRKTDGGDLWWLDGGVVDDLDLWRYRLPASTRPELARTTCTVYWGKTGCNSSEGEEVLGEDNGRLILGQ
ncbi:hypothetical protein FF1_031198 [Malus domestica]